jgi:hypothetical protein
VRGVVNNYLHDISGDTVLGLLEVSIASNEVDRSIFQLLNACPFGGKYLGEIVSQWKYPLPIRQKAIYFIGEVGYLETLPVLERLLNRLEARMNGQYSMDFAPQSNRSDEELYSYLHTAVTQLTAR